MTPTEIRQKALEYRRAEQDNNRELANLHANELRKIPYEEWQRTRAIFPYERKSPQDENYNFRNVARCFEKEYVSKLQLELTRELVQAKRLKLVFVVIGAILGFFAENLVKHACQETSWGIIERLRMPLCEPKS